ncbi:unnamed protein product [Rotaria sp. Silwood2]|nr:unnamed protein product [Rotaria sp. Silwood2]
MDELFEYSDVNSFDTLNSNSTKKSFDELEEREIQKIYEDLVTALYLNRNDPCKPHDLLNRGEVMHDKRMSSEQTSDSDKSDDPGLVFDENNNDTICFNPNEWTIQDPSLSKRRPPKLCEFLHLLLNNSRYTSYASWINQYEGLFKIHEPAEVANLWKKVKLRQTQRLMNYHTFSRSIRYYYKSGSMVQTHRKHTYRFAQKKTF